MRKKNVSEENEISFTFLVAPLNINQSQWNSVWNRLMPKGKQCKPRTIIFFNFYVWLYFEDHPGDHVGLIQQVNKPDGEQVVKVSVCIRRSANTDHSWIILWPHQVSQENTIGTSLKTNRANRDCSNRNRWEQSFRTKVWDSTKELGARRERERKIHKTNQHEGQVKEQRVTVESIYGRGLEQVRGNSWWIKENSWQQTCDQEWTENMDEQGSDRVRRVWRRNTDTETKTRFKNMETEITSGFMRTDTSDAPGLTHWTSVCSLKVEQPQSFWSLISTSAGNVCWRNEHSFNGLNLSKCQRENDEEY